MGWACDVPLYAAKTPQIVISTLGHYGNLWNRITGCYRLYNRCMLSVLANCSSLEAVCNNLYNRQNLLFLQSLTDEL